MSGFASLSGPEADKIFDTKNLSSRFFPEVLSEVKPVFADKSWSQRRSSLSIELFILMKEVV